VASPAEKVPLQHLFKQAGYPVIDADVIARQIVEPNSLALKKIAMRFGRDIDSSRWHAESQSARCEGLRIIPKR
jgi:dephospho-CoA kinase